jgi:hypothetical protein
LRRSRNGGLAALSLSGCREHSCLQALETLTVKAEPFCATMPQAQEIAMPATRRVFMLQVAAGPAALASAAASAQDAPVRVDPKDPQAAALGYTEDASQVDPRRFPRRTAEQLCANCQVYAGRGNEPTGPCVVFAGRLVAAKGWCSAWVLKAA